MCVLPLLFVFLIQHGQAYQLVQTSKDGLAGRRTLQHLMAVKQWKVATAKGRACPPPQPCECHCDCPNTEATGKVLEGPKPCPIYPAFPTPEPSTTTVAAITTTPKAAEAAAKKRDCVKG